MSYTPWTVCYVWKGKLLIFYRNRSSVSFFVLWNLNEHKPTTCSECISYVDCVEHYSTAWGVKTMSEKNWGREKRLVAWWRRQKERKERKGEERRENEEEEEEEEERSGVASKCKELLITMLHLLLPSLLLRSLWLTHGMKKRFRPSVFSMLYLWEGFMVFISHN